MWHRSGRRSRRSKTHRSRTQCPRTHLRFAVWFKAQRNQVSCFLHHSVSFSDRTTIIFFIFSLQLGNSSPMLSPTACRKSKISCYEKQGRRGKVPNRMKPYGFIQIYRDIQRSVSALIDLVWKYPSHIAIYCHKLFNLERAWFEFVILIKFKYETYHFIHQLV